MINLVKRLDMKVLIVERKDLIQLQLKQILTKSDENIIVKQALNYNEAIESFTQFQPDRVMIDTSVYGGSCVTLLHLFKKMNPKVKVIIMGHLPTASFKKICMQYGADNFFEKSNIDHLFFSKSPKKEILLD